MKKAVSVLCLMSLFLFYSLGLTQAEVAPRASLNLQGYLLSWNDGDVKNKIVENKYLITLIFNIKFNSLESYKKIKNRMGIRIPAIV